MFALNTNFPESIEKQVTMGPPADSGMITTVCSCADPESFVRGGSNFNGFLDDENIQISHYKRVIKWRFAGVPIMAPH